MRTRTAVIAYTALGALTVGAYFSVKDFLAWPTHRYIVVSNVTVSYVLALILVGVLSPRITRRIWPKAPKWAFAIVAVGLALAVVGILDLLGAPTRL